MEEIASRHGCLKILLLLTVVSITHVQCDPNQYERTLIVQFNMSVYMNPSGKSLRGEPCSHCDLYFYLYFSGSQRGDLGNITSADAMKYSEKQEHNFASGTPMKANYSREFTIQSNWTNGFTIELDVRVKSGDGSWLEYDNFKLNFQEPKANVNYSRQLQSDHLDRKPKDFSSLMVRYNVTTRCDRRVFYGKLCQVYCKVEDSDYGHQACDTDGKKISCRPGWLDPLDGCRRPDLCTRGYCRNNGNCSNLPNKKYLCTCPKYYSGEHCETPVVVRNSSLSSWLRLSSSGIELLPGTAAVFLGVAAVAMASCLGL